MVPIALGHRAYRVERGQNFPLGLLGPIADQHRDGRLRVNDLPPGVTVDQPLGPLVVEARPRPAHLRIVQEFP